MMTVYQTINFKFELLPVRLSDNLIILLELNNNNILYIGER
jgi:hypothetical protein